MDRSVDRGRVAWIDRWVDRETDKPLERQERGHMVMDTDIDIE